MMHPGRQGTLTERTGGALLWVVIGIALVIAAAIIWIFSLKNPAPNVTTAAYRSSLTSPAPFPTLVSGNVSLQYMVDTRNETRPSGAGPAYPPLTATAWAAASGVTVTFTLVTGNAKFADGTTRFTATSGSNGLAAATIVPSADGVDTLKFAITVGSSTAPDATIYPFEVHKP